jgi:hypothetical protein
MAANKTAPTAVGVGAFIDALPDETKRADAKALVQLMQSATGEKPKMWGPSIVGFGTCHYTYESGREGDIPIACFSPRKAATVIYNLTRSDGHQALLSRLGRHTVGGGCVYIKKLAEVDQTVLKTLIVNSVAAMRARHPD